MQKRLVITLAAFLLVLDALGLLSSRARPVRAVVGTLSTSGTVSTLKNMKITGSLNSTSGGFKFPDGNAQVTAMGDVPTNALMLFNQSACPSGWSEYTAARGFILIGLPSGITNGTTKGTALTNAQNLTHTHGVTPSGTISSTFTGTGGTSGNPSDTHVHTYSGNSGAPSATVGTLGTAKTIASGTHGHSFGSASTAADTAHTHTLTPTGTVSSTFTGSGSTTGTGAISSIIPYIQLLLCQKL